MKRRRACATAVVPLSIRSTSAQKLNHAPIDLASPDPGRTAAATVADLLTESGFEVERGVGELPTALRASYGTGELVVGIVGEYDALPEIGHACGHNVIAGASSGPLWSWPRTSTSSASPSASSGRRPRRTAAVRP
ncbi:MAG: hypothetical protein L0H96_08270 [Humibacillus sp.]|nr:hypothetical protein [Humibacillus sp.]MDN5776889.1 hypothetical protein [Humibacillus sp.]